MEEICQLQCRICQKIFPKFDQRGFRNSGFTAHQNRCIEKDYLLNNPVLEKQLSPKQRLILPAPPGSSSSISPSTHIILKTSSSTSIPAAQKYMPILQYGQYQDQLQSVQQTALIYNGASSYTVDNNQTENFDISLFSPGYSFSKAANNEMIYPITHCGYCNPEFGLHQLSCLLLAQLLHQQRPPM